MKTLLRLVFLTLISGSAVLAETLDLTDGRHLIDARVISQSPLYITVRHAGGFSQIAKSVLPEPWRSKYPSDPVAAAAAAESAKARIAKVNAPRETTSIAIPAVAASPTTTAIKIEQPTPPPAVLRPAGAEETPENVAQKARDVAEASAYRGLNSYFHQEWRPARAAIEIAKVEMKIAKLEQPAGWSGQWTFSGEGSVDYTEVIENENDPRWENPIYSRARVEFDGVLENGRTTIKPRTIGIFPLGPYLPERRPTHRH